MAEPHICPVCGKNETRDPVCVLCKLDPDKKDQVIEAMGLQDKSKKEKLKYICIEGCRTPVNGPGKRCAKCSAVLKSAASGLNIVPDTLANNLKGVNYSSLKLTGKEKRMATTKKKATVTKKRRTCTVCQQEYQPRGNRQEQCEICKPVKPKKAAAPSPGKKRTDKKRVPAAEPGKTLIERKKEFQKEAPIAGLPGPGVSLLGISELIKEKVKAAKGALDTAWAALAEVEALL